MKMLKKHKTKIIIAVVVLGALAAAWFLGAPPIINVPASVDTPASVAAAETVPTDAAPESNPSEPAEINEPATPLAVEEIVSDDLPEYSYEVTEYPDDEDEQTLQDEQDFLDDSPDETPNFDVVPELANPDQFMTTPEGIVVPDIAPGDIQIFAADHPEMRAPVEPEDMVVGDESFTVTLSVRAHTILYNMHLLDRDKHELVPEDGWIFPPTVVTVWEGESVHNVLQREMRRNRIHMSSRWTPMFNSAYVEAINNLYEFDVGPLSGWMYRVNGWFPNFGASRYLLSPGDVVEWIYTVDLGRDLGVHWLAGDLG